MGLHSELNPSSRGSKASPHSGKVISRSITFIKWCIWGLVSSLNNLNNVIFVQLRFTKQSQKEYVSKLFPESCENNKQPIFKVWKAHVWKKKTQVYKPEVKKSLDLAPSHSIDVLEAWSVQHHDGWHQYARSHPSSWSECLHFWRFSISLFVRRLPSRRCSFLTVSAAWNIILMSFLFLRRNFPCREKKNALDFT